MKVLNVHQRIINQPKEKVSQLLETLSTENDKIWPYEKWPKMKFKKGLKEGAKGGHGPIKYTTKKYIPGEFIEFVFTEPKGFSGIHTFEIRELEDDRTELKHTIDMKTSGLDAFYWMVAIRWLHDALVEDAFDKVENQFVNNDYRTDWNSWVWFLRKILS